MDKSGLSCVEFNGFIGRRMSFTGGVQGKGYIFGGLNHELQHAPWYRELVFQDKGWC